MDEQNIRANFIKNIGLSHDPFETPVAEQELMRVQDIFYSYFSTPFSLPSQGDLIKKLRSPQPSFIYGSPGSGKSSLRLNLEADCRTILDETLAITYILGEDIKQPLSHEEHGARLARALSIDLTLTIIERFNPYSPPTSSQISALKRQAVIGGRQLQRLLRTLIEKMTHPETALIDPIWGISQDWRLIGKAPAKYVGSSEELKNLLEELIPSVSRKEISWDDFWQGLDTAQEWGFDRFFILIDGVDTRQRSLRFMLDLISPLFDLIPRMGKQNVFPKMFLPLELENTIKIYLQTCLKGLQFDSFFSIIVWDDATMQRLLAQRFRAATPGSGPHRVGLDSLATPNLNLDKKLINAAEGSPRRLLGIVSDLIDAHLSRDPDSTQFNQDDWESCKKKLEANVST